MNFNGTKSREEVDIHRQMWGKNAEEVTYRSEGNENQGEDEHTCPNCSWKECCCWTHLH